MLFLKTFVCLLNHEPHSRRDNSPGLLAPVAGFGNCTGNDEVGAGLAVGAFCAILPGAAANGSSVVMADKPCVSC